MSEVPIDIGQSIGGIKAFSGSFIRGSGDKKFGVDENGMWLGAENFEDAPFRVDMNGNMYFSAESGDDKLVIDAENLRIMLYINSVAQALWGKHSGGF